MLLKVLKLNNALTHIWHDNDNDNQFLNTLHLPLWELYRKRFLELLCCWFVSFETNTWYKYNGISIEFTITLYAIEEWLLTFHQKLFFTPTFPKFFNMKKYIKGITVILALAFLAISTSSCNRGMGCPNNFSINISTILPN